MKISKKILYFTIVAIVGFTSCSKDLDVEYLNKPNTEKVLSSPDDVYSLTQGLYYNWFMAMNSSWSPRMGMWVSADQGTCSWANSGMYDLSKQPRIPFNNTTSYTYAYVFEDYYQLMWGTLSTTNDILGVIQDSMIIENNNMDNTPMVQAFSYLIQGATMGYLGLVYDKAYIITEDTEDPALQPTSQYKDVVYTAVESLDKAIEVCNNNSFEIPNNWINGYAYSSDEIARLANSMAARLLVAWPRNAAENDQIEWSKVLEYTNNGIQHDLETIMDDVTWNSYFRRYTVQPGWALIDCRIINLMDERYPWMFPEDGVAPAPAQSDDKRLETDFTFNPVNNMKPERGYYHYSNYEYTRYPYAISTWEGPVIDYSQTENELLKAEALANLGNLEQAIDIINNGSRTIRGHLSPISSDSEKDKVIETIFYERDIELIQTGFGLAFFDMRRRNMLQPGSLLHFPIPAKELMVMQMPLYTFGGVDNADGINTSNGGWFPSK